MIQQATLPLFPFLSPAAGLDTDALLERQLRRAALRGEAVSIGSPAEPYVPAELRHGLIRSLLEVSLRVEGLEIAITTGSPRIVRDLDLLIELDKRNAVTVRMAVPAVEAGPVRRIEPQGAGPDDRLRAVRELVAERIAVSVLCSPVVAGVNDGEAGLRSLLTAAREAGAFDVEAHAAALPRASREHFLQIFQRLRWEQGFPHPLAGRG